MPDVFIWMIGNGKRLAYHRIPARDIIFSNLAGESGKFCGKMQTIFLKVRKNFVYNIFLFFKYTKACTNFLYILVAWEKGVNAQWMDDTSENKCVFVAWGFAR